MAYPNDIDSFPVRVADDTIPVADYDNQNDSIIAIETELGTLPKGGAASVKARLDTMQTSIDEIPNKVDISGDTMTGNLTLDNSTTSSPRVILKNNSAGTDNFVYSAGNSLKLTGRQSVHIGNGSNDDALSVGADGKIYTEGSLVCLSTADFRENVSITVAAKDYINTGVGRGLIVKTPDGTKSYRISVDNSGNIISTLI